MADYGCSVGSAIGHKITGSIILDVFKAHNQQIDLLLILGMNV